MRFSWNAKQKRTFQFCETKIAKQLFTFALFAKLNQGLDVAALGDIDADRNVLLTMVFDLQSLLNLSFTQRHVALRGTTPHRKFSKFGLFLGISVRMAMIFGALSASNWPLLCATLESREN